MKKLDWFILVILLISPILINSIVLGVSVGATINGSIDGWLGYYGTLIGSIITMFVLYRRVAFNICIGNSDDHFRNHGFLLTAKGWSLAPAYDMNPTLNEYQSLLINSYTNKSDLNELLNSCEEYMLQKHIAQQIISEVLNAVKYWQSLANRLGIIKTEQNIFYTIFERQIGLYNPRS